MVVREIKTDTMLEEYAINHSKCGITNAQVLFDEGQK